MTRPSSLGSAIGMIMWIRISAIVILFGAELNSEIEHQTARDSTIKSQKPLGARGAVMADTVGPATGRRDLPTSGVTAATERNNGSDVFLAGTRPWLCKFIRIEPR